MAQASTITNVARQRITVLIDELSEVGPILDLIEDPGASDAARQAFFEAHLSTLTNDLNWTDFVAGVLALRSLRTWLTTNRPALSKLRV